MRPAPMPQLSSVCNPAAALDELSKVLDELGLPHTPADGSGGEGGSGGGFMGGMSNTHRCSTAAVAGGDDDDDYDGNAKGASAGGAGRGGGYDDDEGDVPGVQIAAETPKGTVYATVVVLRNGADQPGGEPCTVDWRHGGGDIGEYYELFRRVRDRCCGPKGTA